MNGYLCSIVGKFFKFNDLQNSVSPFREFHKFRSLYYSFGRGYLMNYTTKSAEGLSFFVFVAPTIIAACSVIMIIEMHSIIKRSKKLNQYFWISKCLKNIISWNIKFPDNE